MAFDFEGLEFPGLIGFDVDSLFDDSLINTCTLFDQDNGSTSTSSDVQIPKTEKSPFHESDSGVSEMGGIGSPLWDQEDIPMLDEMLENPGAPFLVGSGQIDDINFLQFTELMKNETNEQIDVKPETVSDSQTCGCARVTRSRTVVSRESEPKFMNSLISPIYDSVPTNESRRSSRTNASRKQSDASTSVDEDQDDQDIDSENGSAPRRKPRGSVQVKRVGERLPSTSNIDKCNVTSIKVLRVVKTGDDSNPEDDISRALEERNRKNAEMARLNRLKKKAYIGNLEQEVEDGRKRIDELESALNDAEEERDSLKREVKYLKSVLANQSALAGLLKNIPNVSGVSLSSSMSRKRATELDHSYTPVVKKSRHEDSTSSSGVCLHVHSDNVSLEFCRHCADMARGGPAS